MRHLVSSDISRLDHSADFNDRKADLSFWKRSKASLINFHCSLSQHECFEWGVSHVKKCIFLIQIVLFGNSMHFYGQACSNSGGWLGWWGLYPLGRHPRVTIPVNRLDPTYYLQAISSFQLGVDWLALRRKHVVQVDINPINRRELPRLA